MSELSKQALKVDNNQSFPNNNNGAITPSILRAFNVNMIDSNVNQTDFDTFSGSVASEFASLTASVDPSITGSSLITASISGQTMTFTKGDGTTFGLLIPDVSGSTINTGSFVTTSSFNAYTASQSTGSLLLTASVNLNTITFTKADASTFNITVDTGSGGGGTISVQDEGSILGNATSFNFNGAGVTATLSAGTASITIPGGGGTIDTGSFATTGSNTFVGNQNITSTTNTQLNIISTGGGQANVEFQAPNSNFQAYGQFNINNNGQYGGSGSIKIITSNNVLNLAADSGVAIGQTNGLGNDIGGGAARLLAYSGSLILSNNAFTNTTASLSHLSSSNNTTLTNLIFKANTSTGATIISGSNNIFTNAGTPTAGYIRYVGGNNNLYLNHINGINSQLTASAASISGVRPVMNNNIFAGAANFAMNYASNPGIAQNIVSNITAVPAGNSFTINALAHTGSLDIYGNLTLGSDGGITTLNISSASVAEVALGLSGSGAFTYYNNINSNGNVTITSNKNIPSNVTSRVNANYIPGGTLTINNISSSNSVNALNNIVNGAITYTNAGAAGLALHRAAATISSNYGQLNLIASASAISATGNICTSALTVTNRSYSGSLGSGSITFNNNQVQGAGHTYTISGSYNGTVAGASMVQNAVFGQANTFYTNVEGRGNYVGLVANGIFGSNLTLTGSNNVQLSEQGGAHIGRWNANDGIRNTTGENIFSVGTGVSGSRKTGFLIDSGSNTFVEGTLNVSGSTTMTGSLYIQSGSTLPSATGSSILTWNEITGQVAQSPLAAVLANTFSLGVFTSTINQSGSAAVSQSMTFNNTEESTGVTLSNNSQLNVATSGYYNIQFSAQLLADTGADDVWIWLKKNGTNVPNTGTRITLANNDEIVAAWNFVVNATAGDYYELVWQNANGHAELLTEPASGNYPVIPSVIVTVTQVR